MLTNNPYDAVDIQAVPISLIGEVNQHIIFEIKTSATKAFDAVVFRRALVDFLFEAMQDQWHLGNDGKFVRLDPNDITLALTPRDAECFVRYGWLV